LQRLLGILAQFAVAVLVSFLFTQAAARLTPRSDQLFFSIITVGAYILGVMAGVYFTSEIFDIVGNFWFLLLGAVFGGVVVFVSYSFDGVTNFGFWDSIKAYITSPTLVGPALATLTYNIGPK
jgi:hypothetical protein